MNQTQYEIYHEKKAHSSDDFPYNTYLCSIPLDFQSVSLHWHEDIEIIVIKKGCGIVTVDLISYTVSAGDLVLIFSGQLHSIMQKGQLCMEYENILFRSDFLRASGEDLCYDRFLFPLFSGNFPVSPVIHAQSDHYEQLIHLIESIDHYCDLQPYAYQMAVKAHLFQFFYTLISSNQEGKTPAVRKKSLEKMKQILSYVAENFAHEITIEDISSHCYYSKSYFMKFFKESMGISFIQYLNDYRLEAAVRLLTATSDNICDIALDTGFENLSYFNRCFKKKYGITPGAYRKMQLSLINSQ